MSIPKYKSHFSCHFFKLYTFEEDSKDQPLDQPLKFSNARKHPTIFI